MKVSHLRHCGGVCFTAYSLRAGVGVRGDGSVVEFAEAQRSLRAVPLPRQRRGRGADADLDRISGLGGASGAAARRLATLARASDRLAVRHHSRRDVQLLAAARHGDAAAARLATGQLRSGRARREDLVGRRAGAATPGDRDRLPDRQSPAQGRSVAGPAGFAARGPTGEPAAIAAGERAAGAATARAGAVWNAAAQKRRWCRRRRRKRGHGFAA